MKSLDSLSMQRIEKDAGRMIPSRRHCGNWMSYGAIAGVFLAVLIPLRAYSQSCAGQIGISIVLTDTAKMYYTVRVDSNRLQNVHSIVLQLLPPLGSGTGFTNIGTGAGWSVVQKTAVELEFKTLFNQPLRGPSPPLPALPVGTFTLENPPDSVMLHVRDLAGRIICEDKQPIPQPFTPADPCRLQRCLINNIVLNTGYDPLTGGVIAYGNPDQRWQLVPPFPDNAGASISNTWAINPVFMWFGQYVQPWANPLPLSQWISAYSYAGWSVNNEGASTEPYRFRFPFCLCKADNVRIKMQYHADNSIRIYLDNTDKSASGWIHQTADYPNDISGGDQYVFMNPPEQVPEYTTFLTAGQHYIEVHLRNLSGTAMGLNIEGLIESATGTPLVFQTHACCNPSGAIIGRKIDDTDCDGVNQFPNNPENAVGLASWTINLSGPGGNQSTATDQYGYYSFTGLLPGNYTVSEVVQATYSPTNPATGSTNIVVNPGETTVVDFLNCKKTAPCAEGVFVKTDDCTYEFVHQNINPHGVAIDDFHMNVVHSTGPVSFEIVDLPSGWSQTGDIPGRIDLAANGSAGEIQYGQFFTGLKFRIKPNCTGARIAWYTTSHATGIPDSGICGGSDTLSCDGVCYVPPDSLIGWWPFDETAGSTAVDLSPLNNTGTWIGTGTAAAAGVVSRSIVFPTSGDIVRIPLVNPFIGAGIFTIDAWVFLNPPVTNKARTIAYRHDGTTGFILSVTPAGKLQFTILNPDISYPIETAGPAGNISIGRWHHIAVVVARDILSMQITAVYYYIDGIKVGTTQIPQAQLSIGTSLDVDKPLIVGGATTAGTGYEYLPLNGRVDELEIFNALITNEEIMALYQAGPCGKCKTAGTSTICGLKYEDVNHNGKHDPGEAWLQGWTIVLTDADGNTVSTTDTDENGQFCFEGLQAGAYVVTEVQQSGWIQTQPGSPQSYSVLLTAGAQHNSSVFGNARQYDCYDVIEDPGNSDPLTCTQSFTVHNPWGSSKPINTINLVIEGGVLNDLTLSTSCLYTLNPTSYVGASVVAMHFTTSCPSNIPGEVSVFPTNPDGMVTLYWTMVYDSTVCYDTTSMWCCSAPCDTVVSWPIPDEETSNDSRTFLIINRTASPIAWIEWTLDPPLTPGAGCSGSLDGGNAVVDGTGLSSAQFVFPFFRIPASGTFSPLAQNTVQFNLGIDWWCVWSGRVHFVVHHADSSICNITTEDEWTVQAPLTQRFLKDPPNLDWLDIVHKIVAENRLNTDIHYISVSITEPVSPHAIITAVTAAPMPKGERSIGFAKLKMAQQSSRQAVFQLEEALKPGRESGVINILVAIDSGYSAKSQLRITAYDKTGSILMVDMDTSTTEVKKFNGTTLPDAFTLLDCFPNPSQGFSTVNFALGKAMQIRLELYSNEGKRVQTLFEGRRESGLHSVRFDSGALPSGTYYIRMEADGGSATLPAAVVK